MLTLYVKTGCAYCAMVLQELEELGLAYDEKNIADDAVTADLVARGGKRQVPYLIDTEAGIEIYESADICEHLEKVYGNSGAKKVEGNSDVSA